MGIAESSSAISDQRCDGTGTRQNEMKQRVKQRSQQYEVGLVGVVSGAVSHTLTSQPSQRYHSVQSRLIDMPTLGCIA